MNQAEMLYGFFREMPSLGFPYFNGGVYGGAECIFEFTEYNSRVNQGNVVRLIFDIRDNVVFEVDAEVYVDGTKARLYNITIEDVKKHLSKC